MPITMLKKIIADLKGIFAALATYKTVTDDTKALANGIRAVLQGSYVESLPALGIGSTKTAVASTAFDYFVGGKRYTKAANAIGTAPGSDVVPLGKFGAVAFDIDNTGTITAVSAPANATGYATAALAAAAIPAVGAGKARMGYVTASKSDGTFTFGTNNFDVANSTVAYTDGTTMFNSIGSAIASSAPATPAQVSGYIG